MAKKAKDLPVCPEMAAKANFSEHSTTDQLVITLLGEDYEFPPIREYLTVTAIDDIQGGGEAEYMQLVNDMWREHRPAELWEKLQELNEIKYMTACSALFARHVEEHMAAEMDATVGESWRPSASAPGQKQKRR